MLSASPSPLPPVVRTQNVSRHCQMSPAGPVVGNYCSYLRPQDGLVPVMKPNRNLGAMLWF